jgi:TRAP-type C4-dicarboxylate transport system substrate-binding protein
MIVNTPGDAAKGVERPAHALNCTKPVVTEADLQVARLRIGGANRAGWSQAMGATPVTMSGNEMLEALAQGVLDCSILSVPDVQNFGMGASVKHITPGEPGGVCVASQTNMNKDTWTSLSDPERGAEMLADFKVIPEKWVGLIQGVSTPEALGDLCWSAL